MTVYRPDIQEQQYWHIVPLERYKSKQINKQLKIPEVGLKKIKNRTFYHNYFNISEEMIEKSTSVRKYIEVSYLPRAVLLNTCFRCRSESLKGLIVIKPRGCPLAEEKKQKYIQFWSNNHWTRTNFSHLKINKRKNMKRKLFGNEFGKWLNNLVQNNILL